MSLRGNDGTFSCNIHHSSNNILMVSQRARGMAEAPCRPRPLPHVLWSVPKRCALCIVCIVAALWPTLVGVGGRRATSRFPSRDSKHIGTMNNDQSTGYMGCRFGGHDNAGARKARHVSRKGQRSAQLLYLCTSPSAGPCRKERFPSATVFSTLGTRTIRSVRTRSVGREAARAALSGTLHLGRSLPSGWDAIQHQARRSASSSQREC